jgi:phosphoenolpyruvate carboxylase
MTDIDARLREDVHLLGELLGNTIRDQYGDEFLDKIEQIRKAPRPTAVVDGRRAERQPQPVEEDELLPVARAFNQFLNLANIAEQYQLIHRRDESQPAPFESAYCRNCSPACNAKATAPNPWPGNWGAWKSSWCSPPTHRSGAAHPDPEIRRDRRATGAQDHRDLTSRARADPRAPATLDRRSLAHRRNPPHPADPVDEAKWGLR